MEFHQLKRSELKHSKEMLEKCDCIISINKSKSKNCKIKIFKNEFK